MFFYSEQLLSATRSNIESQLASINSLNKSVFDSVEKVIALNIAVVKATAEESLTTSLGLLSSRTPEKFSAVTAAEKLTAYNRHLTDIFNHTSTEFATEAKTLFADTSAKVKSLFEEVSKKATASSEDAVSMLKLLYTDTHAQHNAHDVATKPVVTHTEHTAHAVAALPTEKAEAAIVVEEIIVGTTAQ